MSDDRVEPCKVCGEPSSGLNCGAYTCEACKKFFHEKYKWRRCQIYCRCAQNQECVIVRTTRTRCQYCRYQKCLRAGMRLNGIITIRLL